MRFFVGGYTADKGGAATGIGALRAGEPGAVLAGGQLSYADAVRTTGSPSWLAWHPTLPVLYAAMEGSGSVRAWARIGEESFVGLGSAVAAGGSVCHVAVAPDGRWLVASSYDDGSVVRIGLDARGALGSATIGAAAVDPYAGSGTQGASEPSGLIDVPEPPRERTAMESLVALLSAADEPAMPPPAGDSARRSHAHHTRFTPGGLVSTDLGFDQVRIWDTRDGRLRERQRVALPQGTGPRHTLWHPSGHLYIVTEHSDELFVLRPGPDGLWSFVGGAPLLGAQPGADFAAEIAMSRDGRFVYAGLRGSNTISVVQVHGDGADLRSVALIESGVDWPRHHVLERDTLLIAGERSNDIVSLAIDERTGVPGRVRHRVSAPSPACLLADAVG